VPGDIHPGKCVQEMEGGEADVDVAWLAGWRATGNGSPRLLSYGRVKQENGGGWGFAQQACTEGTACLRQCWWI
jgi:hypothetical protein